MALSFFLNEHFNIYQFLTFKDAKSQTSSTIKATIES